MYHDFFGLKQPPFKITPDTRLFYAGGSRGDILEALVYAVSSGEGIVKVVGEVGSGKTMLCRMLEVKLHDDVEIVYLANPSLSSAEILHAIALEMALPVAPDANRLQVMHVLQQRLLEKHAQNRRVVVFVEEAQSMPIDTLEEIRLLSNLETQRDKLLQIVLFGQPELDKNLNALNIRQLKERITHSFYLGPFTTNDVRDYVTFRMRAAGYRGPDVFKASAYRRIAHASKGLIRRVNILADKSLMAAFAENTHRVSSAHVKSAIADNRGEAPRRWGFAQVMMSALLLLAGTAAGWAISSSMRSSTAGIDWSQLSPSNLLRGDEMDERVDVATISEELRDNPPAAGAGRDRIDAESVAAVLAAPSARGTNSALATAREAIDKSQPPISGPGETRTYSKATLVTPGSEQAAPARSAAVKVSQPATARSSVRSITENSQQSPAEPVKLAVGRPEQSPAPEVTGSTAVAGNAKAVSATNKSLLDDRLSATAEWLAAERRGHFSIQLLLTQAHQRKFLERFLVWRERAGQLGELYIYRTKIGDKDWFGVLYSEFSTLTEARQALEKLPDEIKRHKPFIRNIRDIISVG